MLNFDIQLEWTKRLNSGLVVREGVESDGPSFVNLYNLYYANRQTSIDYFLWQYFKSPYDSKLWLIFDSCGLVAYCGLKIYPLNNNLTTGFVIDFLVDESYRKRGLAILLHDRILTYCKKREVNILTALPNHYGNSAFKSLGWSTVAKIDNLQLDLKSWTERKNSCKRLGDEHKKYIQFCRDDIYRFWRFDENPVYEYNTIFIAENVSAVTKLYCETTGGLLYGDIVSWDVSSDSDEVVELVDKVVLNMRSKNVEFLTCWALPHTSLYDCLIAYGFTQIKQERYFCLKDISGVNDYMFEVDKWFLVESDSEVY
jgi:GNAT superfamily N-acetyltransferase